LNAETTIADRPAGSARPGAIVLARHGEPALSRRVRLDSEGYRRWWALYEEGGLLAGQAPPGPLVDLASRAVVLASTRRRSIETARALCADERFRPDAMMIEAPLPPPRWPSFLRFSPRTWGVIARCSWWLGSHQGEESRQQAQARARDAARTLAGMAEQGQDVLVLAHGYFNAMVGGELKKIGWRCVLDQGFSYWAQRRFERI
jgi:broad specificity phosphatase PhoE